jgi:hypothetical protein
MTITITINQLHASTEAVLVRSEQRYVSSQIMLENYLTTEIFD